jgi:hypothetical protein
MRRAAARSKGQRSLLAWQGAGARSQQRIADSHAGDDLAVVVAPLSPAQRTTSLTVTLVLIER